MFYGRKEELRYLNSKYNSPKAEFIILYGRRRIGKTELLRYFCKEKPHIFYVGRECTESEQLEAFSKQILLKNTEIKYISKFSSWEDAFKFLLQTPVESKKLLIIDEFPYTVYSNRALPSDIQRLWDEFIRTSNLMLILCGSSMSFMEKELLSEKAPLYGRATGIYKLEEFDYLTSALFFKDFNYTDKITIYSILGGVPHYLSQFSSNMTISENIKENILSKGASLYNEVEFLIKQELRETGKYYSIIEAIAFGNTKLNDIHLKTGIEARSISVYLNNLIELNIIQREYPVTMTMKSRINSQRGFYKIKDSFFKFYFRYIFPYTSQLEVGDIDNLYEKIIEPTLHEFTSDTFESVCIQYLINQNKTKNLSKSFTSIGRWWEKGEEIDIVAIDIDKPIIAGECKWTNSKVGISHYKNLIKKLTHISLDISELDIYLFAKSGFEKSLVELSKNESNLKLIELEDLFLF